MLVMTDNVEHMQLFSPQFGHEPESQSLKCDLDLKELSV